MRNTSNDIRVLVAYENAYAEVGSVWRFIEHVGGGVIRVEEPLPPTPVAHAVELHPWGLAFHAEHCINLYPGDSLPRAYDHLVSVMWSASFPEIDEALHAFKYELWLRTSDVERIAAATYNVIDAVLIFEI